MLFDSSCEMATLGVLALNLIDASTPCCLSSSIACASTTLLMLGVLWTIIVKRLPLMPLSPAAALDDFEALALELLSSLLLEPQPATTITAPTAAATKLYRQRCISLSLLTTSR